jgi:hypothetical protein
LHAAIHLPFTICKRVSDSLLKRFSQVVETLFKGFACGLHYWFDNPLAYTHPYHLQPVSISWDSPFKLFLQRTANQIFTSSHQKRQWERYFIEYSSFSVTLLFILVKIIRYFNKLPNFNFSGSVTVTSYCFLNVVKSFFKK